MGFEPMKRFWRLRALQARAFDHSAISPSKIGCKNTLFFNRHNTSDKKNFIVGKLTERQQILYLCRTIFCIYHLS